MSKQSQLQPTVLEFIRSQGEAIASEIKDATGVKHQSLSGVLRGLQKRGEVVPSMMRKPNNEGRFETVWVAVADGDLR